MAVAPINIHELFGGKKKIQIKFQDLLLIHNFFPQIEEE